MCCTRLPEYVNQVLALSPNISKPLLPPLSDSTKINAYSTHRPECFTDYRPHYNKVCHYQPRLNDYSVSEVCCLSCEGNDSDWTNNWTKPMDYIQRAGRNYKLTSSFTTCTRQAPHCVEIDFISITCCHGSLTLSASPNPRPNVLRSKARPHRSQWIRVRRIVFVCEGTKACTEALWAYA